MKNQINRQRQLLRSISISFLAVYFIAIALTVLTSHWAQANVFQQSIIFTKTAHLWSMGLAMARVKVLGLEDENEIFTPGQLEKINFFTSKCLTDFDMPALIREKKEEAKHLSFYEFVQDTDEDSSSPAFVARAETKISTPDHQDPNYTDDCYFHTREMCDFCCLVDFHFCSRDIGICEPVSDRNLGLIMDCVVVFGGILCGFPIIIQCCSCFISYRCCSSWYTNTNGVSCYELILRMCCWLCCVKFTQTYKKKDEIELMNEEANKKGLFSCFKKKPPPSMEGVEEGDEGEEGDYEKVEGAEGEEGGGENEEKKEGE